MNFFSADNPQYSRSQLLCRLFTEHNIVLKIKEILKTSAVICMKSEIV